MIVSPSELGNYKITDSYSVSGASLLMRTCSDRAARNPAIEAQPTLLEVVEVTTLVRYVRYAAVLASWQCDKRGDRR